MNRNIAIKEGDNSKTFNNVKKIIIKNTDGSNGYWIPDALGTKHINENGTYKASEEKDEHDVNKGWVGYSEVTVSGIGVASGTDPETGEDAATDKNQNTGNLEKHILPHSIGIFAYPNKMVYQDGEPITLVGIGVRGLMKNGTTIWEGDETHPQGIVPLEELTWEPTNAKFEGDEGDEWEDIETGVKAYGLYCGIYNSDPRIDGFHCEKPTGDYNNGEYYNFVARSAHGYIFYARYNGYIYGVAMGATSHSYISRSESGDSGIAGNPSFANSGTVFNNSNRVSENTSIFSYIKDLIPENDFDINGKDFSHAEKISIKQEITIKWKRPVDEHELTTKLKIVVLPSSNNEDNNNNDENNNGIDF